MERIKASTSCCTFDIPESKFGLKLNFFISQFDHPICSDPFCKHTLLFRTRFIIFNVIKHELLYILTSDYHHYYFELISAGTVYLL